MKKNKKILICCGIAIFCVLGIVFRWQMTKSKKDVSGSDSQSNEEQKTEDGDQTTQMGADGSSPDYKKEEKSDSSETKKKEEEFPLPYTIPNTELVVRKISAYEGVYLENGADVQAKDVCAMLVTNTGKSQVEYAEITVSQGTKQMLFKISTLPAGASVVVQEADQLAYEKLTAPVFSAECATTNDFGMAEDKIKVEELENGKLRVTNLTDEEIPTVRLFYKFYMKEEAVYVGGITYTAKITNLEANAAQEITAKHYSSGNSKIMMIRTYDAEE